MASRPGPPPVTSDEDSVGPPQAAAAAPPQPGPTQWISFSGASNQSAASFIQSIQRIAFTQNRVDDDKWIAQYASTCFTDSALMWYLSLEKEIRSNWEQLRLALVQRYPLAPPSNSNHTITVAQPQAAPPATTDIGRIEVLRPEFGESLGYLSRGSSGKLEIDTSPERALKLKLVLHTDSKHPQERIYSLRRPNDSNSLQFPFLGLRLFKLRKENPNTVPPTKSSGVFWDSVSGAPLCCNMSKQFRDKVGQNVQAGKEQTVMPYATWDFVSTTESKPGPYYIRKAEGHNQKDRVVSGVWTVISTAGDAIELGLTWPEGSKRQGDAVSEIKLDAVVHEGEATGLHVHAYDFVREARSYLDESHVVLLFKPIPNP